MPHTPSGATEPRHRRHPKHHLDDEAKSRFVAYVEAAQHDPSILSTPKRALLLEPLRDAITTLRQLGRTYPAISADLKKHAGIDITPGYISLWLSKSRKHT